METGGSTESGGAFEARVVRAGEPVDANDIDIDYDRTFLTVRADAGEISVKLVGIGSYTGRDGPNSVTVSRTIEPTDRLREALHGILTRHGHAMRGAVLMAAGEAASVAVRRGEYESDEVQAARREREAYAAAVAAAGGD